MIEEPLLPCPFCGSVPDASNPLTFQSNQGGKWGYVVCCCNGPEVRTGYGPLESWKQDAIDAWNDRSLPVEVRKINAAGQENATDGADTEARVRSTEQLVAGDPAHAAPDTRAPNPDEVICPKCVHQFRAIPVNVQEELTALRHQSSEVAPNALDTIREALPEFRQQDDYLLAHGASLMSENSHEIIHVDTLRRIAAALKGRT